MAIEGIDDDRNQPGSTILSKKNPYIDDEKIMICFKLRERES
jgi:hypothetical protein